MFCNVRMDPSQLTLFHFANFANKRPRTDQAEQSSQGQLSPLVSSRPSQSNQLVSDSRGDSEPEVSPGASHLHQDELSEVCDGDISDSESVPAIYKHEYKQQ